MATGDKFLESGRTTEHAPGDEIELPHLPGIWWEIVRVMQCVDANYTTTTLLEICHEGDVRIVDANDLSAPHYRLVELES